MTDRPESVFLTAAWRNLAMLNYEIDADVLRPYLPEGCELDLWNGRSLISVVGFQFLSTRVLGIAIPFHQNFEEVNLRFYVRHQHRGTWRRGVVFIKELVRRRAISWVAHYVYNENYHTLPMRHAVEGSQSGPCRAVYQWKNRGHWEGIRVEVSGTPSVPLDGSEESFIAEHYWGYSRQPDGSTVEYQVEHPPWQVRRSTDSEFIGNVTMLYGSQFVNALKGPVTSAFLADGSQVVVRRGRKLETAGS